MFFCLVYARLVQRFGDDLESEIFPHFRQDFPTFVTESLKCVRRGARFTRASAKKIRATSTDRLGNRKRGLATFDRARPGNDGELIASDTRLAHFDNSFFRPEIERHQFVRFTYSNR